jgi:NAD(P)-dependent dehydrogenase (short-subunit alcohol dehydrogenase family)
MTADTSPVVGVALVTGAGSGLGAAMAMRLAAHGLTVAVNTRSRVDDAAAVVDSIRESGGDGFVVTADVSDLAQVQRMFATVVERGSLRALVNNASYRPRQEFRSITADDWARVRGATLDAGFWCVQAGVPHMARGAAIVNVLGRNALRGDPDKVHVSAAKHGVLGLTLALAEALRADGIAVNAVSPGISPSCARLHECRARIADAAVALALPSEPMVTGTVHEIDCDDLGEVSPAR